MPDEKFASVLNSKREIKVNGVIYKITPKGTFFCVPEKYDKMISLIKNFQGFKKKKQYSEDELRLGHDGLISKTKFNIPPVTSDIKTIEENSEVLDIGTDMEAMLSDEPYIEVAMSSLFDTDITKYGKAYKVMKTAYKKVVNKTFNYLRSLNNKSSEEEKLQNDIANGKKPNVIAIDNLLDNNVDNYHGPAPSNKYLIFESIWERAHTNDDKISKTFSFNTAKNSLSFGTGLNVKFNEAAHDFNIKAASFYGLAKYNGEWLGIRVESMKNPDDFIEL